MKAFLGVIFVLIVFVALMFILIEPQTMTFRAVGLVDTTIVVLLVIAGLTGFRSISG